MPALLAARGLGCRFPDGGLGLDRVDLDLRSGEFTLLAGRNGSGKTLLVRHLLGLEHPCAGEVLFRGEPLRRHVRRARREIGVVFQDVDCQIIGETVEDDLRFGLDNAGSAWERPEEREAAVAARVRRTAALLGLEDRLRVSPHDLSGGERRRLAIGGVLVLEPELIILDEPFANLDYPGVVSVLSLAVELRRAGKGILLITHELEKALAHAERLVIMDRGRVAADGPPVQVAARAGDYGLHPLDFSIKPIETCTWLA